MAKTSDAWVRQGDPLSIFIVDHLHAVLPITDYPGECTPLLLILLPSCVNPSKFRSSDVFFYFHFILKSNTIVPYKTPQNASHLGLFCLRMSHTWTPGLYGLKFTVQSYVP